jgi:hypothetical protein
MLFVSWSSNIQLCYSCLTTNCCQAVDKNIDLLLMLLVSIFIDRTPLDLRYRMKQTQSNHANVKWKLKKYHCSFRCITKVEWLFNIHRRTRYLHVCVLCEEGCKSSTRRKEVWKQKVQEKEETRFASAFNSSHVPQLTGFNLWANITDSTGPWRDEDPPSLQ